MHGISSLLYSADELGEHSFGKGQVGNETGWKIWSFLYMMGPQVLWFYSSSATNVRSYSQLYLGSKNIQRKNKKETNNWVKYMFYKVIGWKDTACWVGGPTVY